MIELLSEKLPSNIGHHGHNVVKALGQNLVHTRYTVRQAAIQVKIPSIQALGALLVTEKCGTHFKLVTT